MFFFTEDWLNSRSDLFFSRTWKLSASCYDYCFYPRMDSQDHGSCCFITAIKDAPVQLWDVITGRLRASYVAPDHVEVIRAANAITFNLDGSKIFCGYTNRFNVFDTGVPGSRSDKIATTSSRRASDGIKGIVSSISFNPDYSGIFAVGTFAGQVGIYDERDYSLLDLKYVESGISQIEFSKNGKMMITASRKSNQILVWDLRNTGQVLFSLPRDGYTNQRLKFSLDSSGKYIGTGDIHGNFSSFDLETGEEMFSQKLYNDVCSSVDFHPFLPLMASTSGERRDHEEDSNQKSGKKVGGVAVWRMGEN
jgi:WD40 repeat protein